MLETEELDVFYLDKDKKNNTKKSASKTNKKKTVNKSKNNIKEREDKFNLDDEIVIGITPKKENKNGQANKNKTPNVKNNGNKPKSKNKKQNKNIIKIVKIFLIIALFVVAIVLLLLSPLFNIKQINVINNSKLTAEQIIALSEIVQEENIFKVSCNNAEKSIKQNSYIEEVKITRKLPDAINIEVIERVSTYMLEFANAFVYINNQGYILEISSEKIETPLIINFSTPLENIKEGNRLINEDLEKLETVLKIMKTIENNEIMEKVTKIDIKDDKNYTLIFEEEGKTAYLGDASNINMRIIYLKDMLQKEKGHKGEMFINRDINTKKAFFREDIS